MRIFAGNSNPELFHNVCNSIGVDPGRCQVTTFSDGEIMVKLEENVRGKDCFIIQSTCHPQNDHLMELLIMLDCLRRSSAKRITAVVPYYGYSRQDQQNRARAPITASLVADMIVSAGAHRVITVDIHAAQSCGFFSVPVDNIYATPVLLGSLKNYYWARDSSLAVVSPDAGGAKRARIFAKELDATLAIVDKRRERENSSEAMNIIGNVKGKECIIVDDILDTAGTMCQAAEALLNEGAKTVTAAITHPVFSGPALERLSNSKLERIFVTDTIPLTAEFSHLETLQVTSIASFLGEVIRRTHNEESISSLFL